MSSLGATRSSSHISRSTPILGASSIPPTPILGSGHVVEGIITSVREGSSGGVKLEEHDGGGVGTNDIPESLVPANARIGGSGQAIQTEARASSSAGVKVEGAAVNGGSEGDHGGQRSKPPPPPVVTVIPEGLAEDARRRGKAKGRGDEECEAMAGVAYRFATALASDHRSVLQPDVETPFADAQDVVRRLLPYHVFLQPKEDMVEMLERPLSELRGYGAFRRPPISSLGKGKRKATEEEWVREEILETRFALDCWKRKTALEKRFRRAKVASGKRLAPDSQAYALAQAVLETERQELAALQVEYRTSKAELDKIEREKRFATSAAASAAASSLAAASSFSSSSHAQTTSSASPSTKAKFYAPGSGKSKLNTNGTTSTTGATSLSTTRPTYGYSYMGTTSSTNNPPASTSTPDTGPQAGSTSSSSVLSLTPMALPTQPIPVTLPVSSLGSLASLGIVPMHPASASQQTGPVAAILRGTTQNGTMVSMEINVGALGGAQASGLAVLLSALTSRSVGGTAGVGSASSGAASEVREKVGPPG
ncbi:hypothetical protein BC835DRAFT_537377 [Cytidiella melzeri]|nr:hypothetical protein BC835DRAFT_537377 [Cytidiella melzeri]